VQNRGRNFLGGRLAAKCPGQQPVESPPPLVGAQIHEHVTVAVEALWRWCAKTRIRRASEADWSGAAQVSGPALCTGADYRGDSLIACACDTSTFT
jgi:hypothetical protein